MLNATVYKLTIRMLLVNFSSFVFSCSRPICFQGWEVTGNWKKNTQWRAS